MDFAGVAAAGGHVAKKANVLTAVSKGKLAVDLVALYVDSVVVEVALIVLKVFVVD